MSVLTLKTTLHTGFATPLVLAAACWGVATVITKGLLAHVPPITLLVVQLGASVTFLWGLVATQRIGVAFNKKALRLGLIGVLNPGLAYTLSLLGLRMTTASISTLLWATEPILILGLAGFLLKERLTAPLIALSTIAIAGALLIIGADTNLAGSPVGNLLVLAGVLCCALYTVFTRQAAVHADPLPTAALQQSAAFGWALAIWPLEPVRSEAAGLGSISIDVWLWTIAAGVMYYALAFWFYIVGLKQAPATIAAMFLNLIPIFGVGGAYLLLGERLGAFQWVGAALIVGAVFGIILVQKRERAVYVQSESS